MVYPDWTLVVRHATPEALTAVAALGGLYAAWRVLSWLARTLATTLRRICVTPILLGALFVGGLGTAGVGAGRWAEWSWAPYRDGRSPLEHEADSYFRNHGDPDKLKAYSEYLKLAFSRPPAPSRSVIRDDPPRLDVSIGLLCAGLGTSLATGLYVVARY